MEKGNCKLNKEIVSILISGDQEISTQRKLGSKIGLLIRITAILFSIMGLWTNSFGLISAMRQSGLFVGFLLLLIFLLYPATKNSQKTKIPIIDWVFAILGASGGLYTYFFNDTFAKRALEPNSLDIFFGILTILLILEASRRAVGKWITIICSFFLIYALFGRYFPGVFAHRGFSFERLIIRMYLVDEGVYGIICRIATTYIFLFILFAAFLKESGVSDFFNNLALSLAGGTVGGPAKVAVIVSAITGTISGSGVANVATTGSFTIPLMKKTGYKPYFAGAVEAAASSGGLLMPPIMGAAAFVMSSFLGISYVTIIKVGVIPAVLYYVAIFSAVHLEALKLGLKGVSKNKLPNLKNVILKRGYLILPLFILLYFLVSGKSPLYAAFMALISTVLLSQVRSETRMGIKDILNALNYGGRNILGVGIACVVCGIIVGVIAMTGVGQMVGYNILLLSKDNLLLVLFFTMITSIFLSMGLPATACYIIVSSVCAPALMQIGVIPIVAHFFVFYFGCLSNLTPPVCLASFTGAAIAKADPSKVAWTGLRLAFASFIIPYVFVYSPQLLLQEMAYPKFFIVLGSTFLAVISFAIAERGFLFDFLKTWERILFFLASLLLIIPGNISSSIGLILLITIIYIHKKGIKIIKKIF